MALPTSPRVNLSHDCCPRCGSDYHTDTQVKTTLSCGHPYCQTCAIMIVSELVECSGCRRGWPASHLTNKQHHQNPSQYQPSLLKPPTCISPATVDRQAELLRGLNSTPPRPGTATRLPVLGPTRTLTRTTSHQANLPALTLQEHSHLQIHYNAPSMQNLSPQHKTLRTKTPPPYHVSSAGHNTPSSHNHPAVPIHSSPLRRLPPGNSPSPARSPSPLGRSSPFQNSPLVQNATSHVHSSRSHQSPSNIPSYSQAPSSRRGGDHKNEADEGILKLTLTRKHSQSQAPVQKGAVPYSVDALKQQYEKTSRLHQPGALPSSKRHQGSSENLSQIRRTRLSKSTSEVNIIGANEEGTLRDNSGTRRNKPNQPTTTRSNKVAMKQYGSVKNIHNIGQVGHREAPPLTIRLQDSKNATKLQGSRNVMKLQDKGIIILQDMAPKNTIKLQERDLKIRGTTTKQGPLKGDWGVSDVELQALQTRERANGWSPMSKDAKTKQNMAQAEVNGGILSPHQSSSESTSLQNKGGRAPLGNIESSSAIPLRLEVDQLKAKTAQLEEELVECMEDFSKIEEWRARQEAKQRLRKAELKAAKEDIIIYQKKIDKLQKKLETMEAMIKDERMQLQNEVERREVLQQEVDLLREQKEVQKEEMDKEYQEVLHQLQEVTRELSEVRAKQKEVKSEENMYHGLDQALEEQESLRQEVARLTQQKELQKRKMGEEYREVFKRLQEVSKELSELKDQQKRIMRDQQKETIQDPQKGSIPDQQKGGMNDHQKKGGTVPEKERRIRRAPRGLPNLGNSCYINSVAQCLFTITPLRNYFMEDLYKIDLNVESEQGGEVATVLAEVFNAIETGDKPYGALKNFQIVLVTHDPMFRPGEQQDAHDFLSFLLQWLHNDLRMAARGGKTRERDDDSGPSIVSQLFHGQQESTITCPRSGLVLSAIRETFHNLTLVVPEIDHCSLEGLLKRHYREQEVEWDCERCGGPHDSTYQPKLLALPEVLVIHFSRYSDQAPQVNPRGSRKTTVYYPMEGFTLDHVMTPAQGFLGQSPVYDLVGVVCHYGSSTKGHYTAFCRRGTDDDDGDKKSWCLWNDTEGVEVSADMVSALPEAHILFYQAAHESNV